MKNTLTTFGALILIATLAFAGDSANTSHGTVTKVDTKWNKVTIDHGPLENLDMPAMKMVFKVADPAMIKDLKEGMKINFVAEMVNGALTVTELKK